jgi:hypothetical protein
MSTTIVTESPVYVQTQFIWDEPTVAQSAVVDSRTRPTEAVTRDSGRRTKIAPTRGGVRHGKCEHVGSALVSVLGNYGISLDDLLDEIERQRKEME